MPLIANFVGVSYQEGISTDIPPSPEGYGDLCSERCRTPRTLLTSIQGDAHVDG